jgi:hypothetical protein
MEEEYPTGALSTSVSVVLLMLGLVLIGFGIFALVGAILAAWNLFHHPQDIAVFADYFLNTAGFAAVVDTGATGLAHTFAWVVLILLLMLLGKLGVWAVSAGAHLFVLRPSGRH